VQSVCALIPRVSRFVYHLGSTRWMDFQEIVLVGGWGGCGPNWSGQGQVAESCKHSDHPLGSINVGNFLTSSGTVSFLTKTLRSARSLLVVMVNAGIIPSNGNRILHPDPCQFLLIIYDEICIYLDWVFTLIVRGPKESFWKLRWATCHLRHCTGLIILFKIKYAFKNVP